jgi:diketogulonate reductase-like aldo/keto reductase
LKRIGQDEVDLYQIHFPFPAFSNSALMESLKEAVEEGLTTAVGVSNYSPYQLCFQWRRQTVCLLAMESHWHQIKFNTVWQAKDLRRMGY